MKLLHTLILVLFTSTVGAQINMEDSTAQTISYWNKGEKQSYTMSLQRVKLKGADTTSNELMTYEVDITVLDSTENSYTLEWFYYNYKSNTTNELLKKMNALAEDIKVVIETDALGVFKSVKNWQEVRDYVKKAMVPLREEFKSVPQLKDMIDQMEGTYTTKEAIESMAIQDVQQYHTFHGAKYTLGQVLEFQMKTNNLYAPDKPFDTDVTLYLDEINPDDNNYILRATQEINSEQLTKTTFEYLKALAGKMGVPPPKQEDVGTFTNITNTASRIHGTGWVIYSIQTKTVEGSGTSSIEERIMEIK